MSVEEKTIGTLLLTQAEGHGIGLHEEDGFYIRMLMLGQ